jgi:hypothetical protein
VDHFPGGIVIATVAVIVLVMGIGIVTSPRTAEHASPPNYREASRAVHVDPPSTHARRLVPRVARLNPVEEIPETIGVPGVRSSRGGIESRDGSFRGDAYVNEFFGLSIELPKDWTLPDRTARRTVARATAARIFRDPAMRQTVIESVDSSDEQLSLFMCASGEQSGASITLKAFRVDELEPDFRVQDVLETFSANAAAIFVDAPRVGPTQPVDLGGVRWWRVRFVVDSDGVILRNALFARIERGWILMLATCDRTVGERAEIQAALDSVRCW